MKSLFTRKADTSTSQSKPPPSAPSASYKFWASSSKQPGSSSSQALKRDKVDATGYAQPSADRPPTRASAQATNTAEPDGARGYSSNNAGYSSEPSRPHYSRKPSAAINPSSRPTPSIISPLPHQSSFAYGSRDASQDPYRSDRGYTTEPVDRSRERTRDREKRLKDREKSTTRPEEPELRRERRHLREVSVPPATERDDRRRAEQKEQERRRQADEEARERRREDDRRLRREGREKPRYESADARAHDYRAMERNSDAEEAQKAEALRLKAKAERDDARAARRARRASEAAEEAARRTRLPSLPPKPGTSQDYYSTSRPEPPIARPDRIDIRQKSAQERNPPSNPEPRNYRLPREGYEEHEAPTAPKSKVFQSQQQREPQRNSIFLSANTSIPTQSRTDPYATIPSRATRASNVKQSDPPASGTRSSSRAPQDAVPRSHTKGRSASMTPNVPFSPKDKGQTSLPNGNVPDISRSQARPETSRPPMAFSSASAAAAAMSRDTSSHSMRPTERPTERTYHEPSTVIPSRRQPSNEHRSAGAGVADAPSDPYPNTRAVLPSSSANPAPNNTTAINSSRLQQSNSSQPEPPVVRQNESRGYTASSKAHQSSSYQTQVISSASASAARAAQQEPDSTRLQPPVSARYGGFPVAKVPSSSSAQSHDNEAQRVLPPRHVSQPDAYDDRKTAPQKQVRIVSQPTKLIQRTAEPGSDPVNKYSPPPILRRPEQAAQREAEDDDEVILPVPVPRSLGLQPLYGPPEDEVRAEAAQAKQREAGRMNLGWDNTNAKLSSSRDQEHESPNQRATSHDNPATGPSIQRPTTSMASQALRSENTSRQIADAKDLPSRKKEVPPAAAPLPAERTTQATKPTQSYAIPARVQEKPVVMSPQRHQRQLSEPIIRDAPTSHLPSAATAEPRDVPSKRPMAAPTETFASVNTSQHPPTPPEISKREERPSPKAAFVARQEVVDQAASNQLHKNSFDPPTTTRASKSGGKKKSSKHARSQSAQEANGRADMSQNYLSVNGRGTKQPSYSSESPASKRSDVLTSTPESRVGNPPGFTPPINGVKPMHQPSPVLNSEVEIVKHPRLEELLSDPVSSLQETSSRPARNEVPVSASNAYRGFSSNQFSSASAYAKRRSPVNPPARLKPSPDQVDSRSLAAAPTTVTAAQAPTPTHSTQYANTPQDPDIYGFRHSPDFGAAQAPNEKDDMRMQRVSPEVSDVMPIEDPWEGRPGTAAPTMPSRLVNASNGSTSQYKPFENAVPFAGPDVNEPMSPSLQSRPNHESNAPIFNGFPKTAATHANHALHGGAAAQQAIANSSRRPSPATGNAPALQLDVSAEAVSMARAPSQDSVLKTPSSLAHSMMPSLRPTMSRASQQVSGDEGRKKGGLLRMFRSSSKPTETPSSSQHQLWRPSTREQDSASMKDRREGPAKLKKAAPVIADDDASEERPSPPKSKRPPPIQVPIAIVSVPDRERKSPRAGGVFTPFRYLTSKRHRTVSGASVDVNDGFSTVANTLGSPTASLHSSAPLQPPPLRDPLTATEEWRDNREHTNGPLRVRRPGVVFDVEQEMFEDKQSVKNFKPRASSSRPPRKLTRDRDRDRS